MNFSKMEGLGNDFVVLDGEVAVDKDLVRRLCDRHFGIGADGLLQVRLDGATVQMDYWNADGSDAEMCGNGLRCVARYAFDTGLVSEPKFVIRTAAGDRRVEVGAEVRVEIGAAQVGESREWSGRSFYAATVGNPHLVSLGDDPEKVNVPEIGAALERATPGGANVGFGSVNEGEIKLRVWERGVGETMACGSGMVAAAAVAQHLRLISSPVTMTVSGGRAVVELEKDTTWLTGPAQWVFRGEFF